MPPQPYCDRDARTEQPSRTGMVADAMANGGSAAQSADTALGATLITGHLLYDLESRLCKAEETTFGPRPADKNQVVNDTSGLINHGRNNVERLTSVIVRVNQLLSAIGI